MNTKKVIFRRLAAGLLIFSLLFALAGCGEAPEPTGVPDTETPAASSAESHAAPGSNIDPSKLEPAPTGSSEMELPTKPGIILPVIPSPGTVKAGNLIDGIEAEAVEGKKADGAFTDSQYAFAARLLADSYREDGGNCLVSPLSVMLALAMTANGAAGETLQQMLDVLGGGMTMDDLNAYLYEYVKNLPSSEKAKLAAANSIWLNDRDDFTVRDEFLKKDVSWYGADIYKTPFSEQTVNEVNGWVSKNTDKMIEEIIQSLEEDARMLLINAICFDAKWQDPYQDVSVNDMTFTRADGSKQTVSMMHSIEYEYYRGEDYTGFAKYYDGRGYKFVGILPDEDLGLDKFIGSLDGGKLSSILNTYTDTRVNGGLPKFSYEYEASLKDRLTAMGMKNAFNSNQSSPDFADFSMLSSTEPLYVNDVVHKTFIEMTQAGTRAAAVTAVPVFTATGLQAPPMVVNLDRPFLYMIVDTETNLPIFIGTVNSVS